MVATPVRVNRSPLGFSLFCAEKTGKIREIGCKLAVREANFEADSAACTVLSLLEKTGKSTVRTGKQISKTANVIDGSSVRVYVDH